MKRSFCWFCRAWAQIYLYRNDPKSGLTVQTNISLLLEKQSDQGLQGSPFSLHLLDYTTMVKPPCSNLG